MIVAVQRVAKRLLGKYWDAYASLGDSFLENLQGLTTLKVYGALSFTGIIRIDYLYHSGKLYLNEINSVPGSLALYLFSEDPKDFKAVITDIIEEGEREFNRKNSAVKSIKTGIFSSSGSKGSKGAKR